MKNKNDNKVAVSPSTATICSACPELEKLRSRWRRWLGQITKNEHYTRLLQSDFSTWMRTVCRNHGIEPNWKSAINVASSDELRNLDCVNLNDKMRW